MKKADSILLLLFVLLLGARSLLISQTKTALKNDSLLNLIDSLKEESPSLEISSEFSNKVVFWGRNFGREQYGFENNLIYKAASGVYASYTGYVWSAMPNRYAKTDLGLGYQNQLTDEFYFSFEYQRWFFNNGDHYVRNALANYLEAQVNYDFGFITVEPTFYYMFGLEHIFQSDVELSRQFILTKIFKSGQLQLMPKFLSTFANQGFLPIYSESPPGFVNERKFKCVDLEVSVPLALSVRNFEAEATVHYNDPIKINNETVKPFFYFSVRVSYNFFFSQGKLQKLYKDL